LLSPAATNTVYERFRSILHEAQIDKRVQYMIEILFQVRKEKFKEHPIVIEELDLVEEEEQITHFLSIDEELDGQDSLNIFKFDSSYLENEEKYQRIKAEILGEDSDEEEGSSDEEQEETENAKVEIQDRTSTNLVNLRKTIYLVVMSSVDFEECVHKLIKLNIAEGQEIELCKMLIECNSQERTYNRYYGLIGERLCKLNQIWMEQFDKSFRETFETIHRYETSRIRNTGRFFGHLFSMDALPWSIFEIIRLNEEETTSASRIFIKVLFQDLCESLGLKKLKERLSDPFMQEFFTGIFPKENPRNTRFSINYFTSIGLGGITDDMREFLKQKIQEQESSDESEEDSSEYESSDQSDSESEPSSPRRDHNGKLVEAEYNYRMRSPSPSRSRGRSPSRSRSPARRHHESRSRHRETDRSPVRRHREHERSRSRHRRTSRSPVKRRDTSRSPVRRHRETYRSPVRRHHERSRSRHRETSRSPVRRHRERSRSPVRRRHESPSRESSRSPTREKRSRSINRRSRSRTPKRYNKRSRSRSRH
ncbi:MA3-domain-containing protein, partial [Rozella allomycis CSF55]